MLASDRLGHVCQYGKIIKWIRGAAVMDIQKTACDTRYSPYYEDINAEADK